MKVLLFGYRVNNTLITDILTGKSNKTAVDILSRSIVGAGEAVIEIDKNPIKTISKIVVGGITFGVASDFVADWMKKEYANTDIEKIYSKIKMGYK